MYRSVAGGLAGAIAASVQYWVIPPTAAQELLRLWLGWDLSVDTAGFLGTLAVGAVGTLVTHFAPKQAKPSEG
jgi:hypothetical protein